MPSSYIDIHNHILPGLDDGPEAIAGSIEMARVAYRNGIEKIIATPHHNDYYQPTKDNVYAELNSLNEILKKESIPVSVYSGNEIRISPDISEKLSRQDVLPLAESRFILLELPFNGISFFAPGIIMDLINDRWRPILAHCERIFDIQQKPKLLERYIEMGCMVQVNSTSLTGEQGKTSYRSSVDLLKLGYVDIIASDAHDAHRRPPDFKAALKIASRIVGRSTAEAMVSETPAEILSGIST